MSYKLCASNQKKATPEFCPLGSSSRMTSFNLPLKADAIRLVHSIPGDALVCHASIGV